MYYQHITSLCELLTILTIVLTLLDTVEAASSESKFKAKAQQ